MDRKLPVGFHRYARCVFNLFRGLIEHEPEGGVISLILYSSSYMKKQILLTVIAALGVLLGQSQARIQVIHNSADAAAEAVDIFVNGNLFVPNLEFRHATPFADAPAGVPLNIQVAPEGAGVGAAVASFPGVVLTENETYVIVANGIVSPIGYNPSPAFTLDIFPGAREVSGNSGEVDILVCHGSTDASMVDVVETLALGATAVNDISYGEFQGYLSLPEAAYRLAVTSPDQSIIYTEYDADLSAAGGAAITIVASGFLLPFDNNFGPGFGLWVATAGGGPLVALPPSNAAPQYARVQVIHNSPDAAAASVDIYINGNLTIPGLQFRHATEFLDVPAAVTLDLAITPAGAGLGAAVATIEGLLLDPAETYVVVANGTLLPGYNPAQPFGLEIYPGARESALDPDGVDILVVHGSTDAADVDVLEVLQINAQILNDFTYGSFSGYFELPEDDYRLEVTNSDQTITIGTYDVPLASLGLAGSALTVVASGFVAPGANNNGPGFGLWVATSAGGLMLELPVYSENNTTARIQIIHNAADAAAASVDIFANGTLLVPGLNFREATPFFDVPAGVDLTIDIAPAGAGLLASVFTASGINLTADERYVVVANGIVSGSGYSPAPAFGLDLYAGARESALVPTEIDVLAVHGSTDAPTVQVREANFDQTLISDFSYGDIDGYLSLELANYVLNVTDASGTTTLFSYRAPLAALNLAGEAITVVASGFVSPGDNSNGPGFGLWVATASGGPLIALPAASARVQIIHNSADPAAALVDIYASGLFTGVIEVDDLGFRQATPFVDVPANVGISVEIAASNSTGPGTAELASFNFNLQDGQTYVITASGVVAGGFNPQTPFSLEVYTGARESSFNASNVDVLVLHGATDAPTVDITELSLEDALVTNLSYGEYAGYLSLTAMDYILGVGAAGEPAFARFAAPLGSLGLAGRAITVLASGFLNPSNNNDGEAFGLWATLSEGGDLIELPAYLIQTPARVQVIHNAADAAAASVDVYVESAFSVPLAVNDFAFRTATPFIDVISETDVLISVAPAGSNGPEDAIAQFTVNLTAGETYVVVANGIVSASGYNPSPSFGLDVFAGAREAATQTGFTDVLVYHGATDAPAVDVIETGVGAGTIVSNLTYGEFDGYLELATANYQLDIAAAGGSPVVATYGAPLQTLGLDGAALTVLASGFLDPSENSNGAAFGLWVALPGGGELIPLPFGVNVEEQSLITGFNLYPNPANEAIRLLGQLNASGPVMISVIDAAGRLVLTDSVNTGNGSMLKSMDVSALSSGIYTLQLTDGKSREAVRFSVIR